MVPRTVLLLLALALLFAGAAGCNRAKAPGPPPVVGLRPSEVARNDLLKIAKKIEEPAAQQQIEFYVASFEDRTKGWSWSDLDEYIHGGSYSIQTRQAYDNYRRLKILESKK